MSNKKKTPFNEYTLQEEIHKTWGEHGAHSDVYRMLLKQAQLEPDINVNEKMFLLEVKDKLEFPSIKRDIHSYSILTKELGMVFYYPKGDKLQIKKTNEWLEDGLLYMIENWIKK